MKEGAVRKSQSVSAGSKMSADVATGVNIYQKGQDPPLLPDSEYPDWLWEILKRPKTLKQLREEAQKGGGPASLCADDLLRLDKLERKEKIKAHNQASSKHQ
jgi:large subunit ribosomal protein L54